MRCGWIFFVVSLHLDAPMFAKFIEFIYPEQDFDVIDEGWRQLADVSKWEHDP